MCDDADVGIVREVGHEVVDVACPLPLCTEAVLGNSGRSPSPWHGRRLQPVTGWQTARLSSHLAGCDGGDEGHREVGACEEASREQRTTNVGCASEWFCVAESTDERSDSSPVDGSEEPTDRQPEEQARMELLPGPAEHVEHVKVTRNDSDGALDLAAHPHRLHDGHFVG